jgi:hypothetical protein
MGYELVEIFSQQPILNDNKRAHLNTIYCPEDKDNSLPSDLVRLNTIYSIWPYLGLFSQ